MIVLASTYLCTVAFLRGGLSTIFQPSGWLGSALGQPPESSSLVDPVFLSRLSSFAPGEIPAALGFSHYRPRMSSPKSSFLRLFLWVGYPQEVPGLGIAATPRQEPGFRPLAWSMSGGSPLLVGFELLPQDGFVTQAIQIYFQLSFTDADALFFLYITAQSVGWVWSGIRERLTCAEAQRACY